MLVVLRRRCVELERTGLLRTELRRRFRSTGPQGPLLAVVLFFERVGPVSASNTVATLAAVHIDSGLAGIFNSKNKKGE